MVKQNFGEQTIIDNRIGFGCHRNPHCIKILLSMIGNQVVQGLAGYMDKHFDI